MQEIAIIRGANAIRVVCAWCGALVRASGDPDALTSHGICPACADPLAQADEEQRWRAGSCVPGTSRPR